jgi:hypothetical protein
VRLISHLLFLTKSKLAVRVLILKDLYDNEVAPFHHYSIASQDEVKKMDTQNMVFFGNTLFSKSEQSYFNY